MKKNTVRSKLKFPLTKVVEISWADANTTSGWDSASVYKSHDVCACVTVGYLLKQTKDSVVVLGTQGLHNTGQQAMNQAIAIPLSWISKIKILRK